MNNKQEYWEECIAIAAEECGLDLTPDQLSHLADSAMGGHEHYGMAFYTPPWTDRMSVIEDESRQKIASLEAELARYRDQAETAVKRALGMHDDDHVVIEPDGGVIMRGGRSVRIL